MLRCWVVLFFSLLCFISDAFATPAPNAYAVGMCIGGRNLHRVSTLQEEITVPYFERYLDQLAQLQNPHNATPPATMDCFKALILGCKGRRFEWKQTFKNQFIPGSDLPEPQACLPLPKKRKIRDKLKEWVNHPIPKNIFHSITNSPKSPGNWLHLPVSYVPFKTFPVYAPEGTHLRTLLIEYIKTWYMASPKGKWRLQLLLYKRLGLIGLTVAAAIELPALIPWSTSVSTAQIALTATALMHLCETENIPYDQSVLETLEDL